MGKTRHWLLLLGSLALLACSAPATSAEPLTEDWATPSFSSLLESGGPPEFGRCIKTTGGQYEDSGCTTTGSGKSYEWHPAFGGSMPLEKTGFSNLLLEGTAAEFETVGGNLITCKGEKASGKYTGNKTTGGVVVTFSTCSTFGLPCTSAGAPSGTIVTSTLEGVLGVEEPGAEPRLNKIGEELFPAGHSGPMGEFVCAGTPLRIAGSIISPVAANTMKFTATIHSKAAKGKQRPEKFFEQPAEVLTTTIEGGSPEQSGETLQTFQTNQEKVEINSVL